MGVNRKNIFDAGAAIDTLADVAKKMTGRSTEPINSVNSFYNPLYLARNLHEKQNLRAALKETFKGEEGRWDTFKVGGDNYSAKAIAGGMSMLGIGYRALSGGGAYKNKDGDLDIAGVPFL